MRQSPNLPRVQREIGLRVRQARESSALTQEEAAARADIDVKRWQRIEAGQVNLTVRTLHRIAVALTIDFWALLKPPIERDRDE